MRMPTPLMGSVALDSCVVCPSFNTVVLATLIVRNTGTPAAPSVGWSLGTTDVSLAVIST
jgi:hypothetical protein